MLEILSMTIPKVLNECENVIGWIFEAPCKSLEAGVKLKHESLCNGSLILAIGPVQRPSFKSFTFNDVKIRRAVEAAHEKLSACLFHTNDWCVNFGGQTQDTAWTSKFEKNLRSYERQSAKEFGAVYWAYVYKKLHDVDYDGDGFVIENMVPILLNNLSLDTLHRRSGTGDCKDMFLCASADESSFRGTAMCDPRTANTGTSKSQKPLSAVPTSIC